MLVHMMSMIMPQAVAKMVVSAVTIEVSWCGVGGLCFKTWQDGRQGTSSQYRYCYLDLVI